MSKPHRKLYPKRRHPLKTEKNRKYPIPALKSKAISRGKEGFGKLLSLNETKELILPHIQEIGVEKIDIALVLNRILAEDIIAPIDVPHFKKSAMDGFAVIASDTFGANNTTPKEFILKDSIFPGDIPSCPIKTRECLEIATGAAMPEGADAVVMVEYTEKSQDRVTIYKTVAPDENVIGIGSDIKQGTQLLSKGTILKPKLTALLSAIGLSKVCVKIRPRIGVLSTGNELIRPNETLHLGKVYDINSRGLIDAILEHYCTPVGLGIAKDDKEELKAKVMAGIKQSDLLLVSGSSSLGATDILVDVIESSGQVLAHGIAVKPGKPTVFGKIKEKLIVGLPGHPTSCLSNLYILIVPILEKMLGCQISKQGRLDAHLTRKVVSTVGRYEFLSVKIVHQKGGVFAEPLMKGSSAITTLANADGFIEIHENVEILEKGEKVKVKLF